MSMTMLTILQFIFIFLAYTFVTVFLPNLVLRKKLRGKSVALQFFISYCFGNFYIINLVLLLQLAHISNLFTLLLGSILPPIFIWGKVNDIPLAKCMAGMMRQIRRLSEGKLGLRTLIRRFWYRVGNGILRIKNVLGRTLIKNPLQWLFLYIILGGLCWIYGRQIIIAYGYAASDIPVHMEWINEMGHNNVFSDGVYPFGFHCIIYYLHVVFGIDTYVLLRLFSLVQNIYVHLVLLGFLKLCCKSKYLPYAGVFIYCCSNYFAAHTYSRLLSTLPQEFGMIFILPAIYFAFAFFEHKDEKDKYLLDLTGFAVSFSLTLAIHFYGTMIAGLFCIGIVVGYLHLVLRPKYLWKILVTGILSVVIAVLPMGIAFVTGTPLQGSLRWGMSVMQGDDDEEDEEDESETQESESEIQESESETQESESETQESESETQESESETQESESETQESESETLEGDINKIFEGEHKVKVTSFDFVWKLRGMKAAAEKLSDVVAPVIQVMILNQVSSGGGYFVLALIGGLFILGCIFWIFRKRCYGGMFLSISVFMFIMTALLAAGNLNLPTIMDSARCSMYYSYLLPLVPVLLVDGTLYFLFYFKKTRIIRNICSLAITVFACYTLIKYGQIKEISYASDYVTNEAITCLANIIQSEEDGTWTICSANDETQMGIDHGYHYELIDFLSEMEYASNMTQIIIPTKSVYFFIEKIPLNYAISYPGSGQSISIKGALQTLPYSSGINMYQGESRWILMSRIYYWAKAFQKLYPNEMKVYCETDSFICYKIEQNMYHQYNFAIDYGFNHVEK